MNDQFRETQDNEIQFSRTVKAGKRIYYLDIKKDRHGELYMSITESKRVKDATEEERPVFEKHKIFLYREDMERFAAAFMAAAEYAENNCPPHARHRRDPHNERFVTEGQMAELNEYDENDDEFADPQVKPLSEFRFDIDF